MDGEEVPGPGAFAAASTIGRQLTCFSIQNTVWIRGIEVWCEVRALFDVLPRLGCHRLYIRMNHQHQVRVRIAMDVLLPVDDIDEIYNIFKFRSNVVNQHRRDLSIALDKSSNILVRIEWKSSID
jgi:hypothetical protein